MARDLARRVSFLGQHVEKYSPCLPASQNPQARRTQLSQMESGSSARSPDLCDFLVFECSAALGQA
eukprot:3322896-Pyramimonas_sp.AAC.1